MATDTIFSRFTRRDPVLVAALFSGNPQAVAEVTRLLRHTPLQVLLQHRAALVIALVAMPETHRRLIPTWMQQDANATTQLFCWVEQSRRRVSRGASVKPFPSAGSEDVAGSEEVLVHSPAA